MLFQLINLPFALRIPSWSAPRQWLADCSAGSRCRAEVAAQSRVVFVYGGVAEMPQGVIKKLVADKGFGFIDGGGRKDLFFHCSEVADGAFETLWVGQTVEYEEGEGPKGPRAQNVRPLDAQAEA